MPKWFDVISGPIIRWHIASSGHQSGALDYAKNYGILVSDTKQLVEIICKSKKVKYRDDYISYVVDNLKEELYFQKDDQVGCLKEIKRFVILL